MREAVRALVVAGAKLARSTDSRVSPINVSISSMNSTSGLASASAHWASTSISAPSAPPVRARRAARGSASRHATPGARGARVRRAWRASSARCPRVRPDRPRSRRRRSASHHRARVQQIAEREQRRGLAGLARRMQHEVPLVANQAEHVVKIDPRQRCDLVVPLSSDRTGSVERAHGASLSHGAARLSSRFPAPPVPLHSRCSRGRIRASGSYSRSNPWSVKLRDAAVLGDGAHDVIGRSVRDLCLDLQGHGDAGTNEAGEMGNHFVRRSGWRHGRRGWRRALRRRGSASCGRFRTSAGSTRLTTGALPSVPEGCGSG